MKDFSEANEFLGSEDEKGSEIKESNDNEILRPEIISRFNHLYTRLFHDAYVFFIPEEGFDWGKFDKESSKLSALKLHFYISNFNKSFISQYKNLFPTLKGISFGEFFKKQLQEDDLFFYELFEDGKAFKEYSVTLDNDKILHLEIIYQCLFNEKGHPDGIFGIHRDITEQIQILDALQKSEERLQKLAHLSFQGIAFYRDGDLIDVNEALLRLLGVNREQVLKHGLINDRIPSEHHRILFYNAVNETIQ